MTSYTKLLQAGEFLMGPQGSLRADADEWDHVSRMTRRAVHVIRRYGIRPHMAYSMVALRVKEGSPEWWSADDLLRIQGQINHALRYGYA